MFETIKNYNIREKAFKNVFQAMIIKNIQPAMYQSLTDMVDDNSMMDLSQYFRLGKKQLFNSPIDFSELFHRI